MSKFSRPLHGPVDGAASKGDALEVEPDAAPNRLSQGAAPRKPLESCERGREMDQRPHLAIWSALAFMVSAGVAARVLTSGLDWGSEEAAAWTQAAGSVLGLGIAVWIGADAARSAKQTRAQAEEHRKRRVEAVQWAALHVASQADSVVAAAEFMLTDPEALESLHSFGFGDWNFQDVVSAIDAIPVYEAESADIMHLLGRIKIVVRAAQTRMPKAIEVLRKRGHIPQEILRDFQERTVHAKGLTMEMAAAIASPAPGTA